jgi:NSS family neurotransmitter:Na+ symporter
LHVVWYVAAFIVMPMIKHSLWTSKWTFLFATAGAAVGLGNVWRFSFLTGQNGGAAFVLVYLAFVFVIGVPIIMAELAIGRMGQLSPIGSIKGIIQLQDASHFWQVIGKLSLVVPFIGFTFYSVVTGWTLYYAGQAITNAFKGVSSVEAQSLFEALTLSPMVTIILQGVVVVATAVIVGNGLRQGIERTTKIMVPGLGVILLLMVAYNVFAADMSSAIEFLFSPNFSELSGTSILLALGQAFFSVGVGVGFMMTYGAYLPKDISIPKAAFVIGSVDTGVALLAGLAIFPIVFATGLDPSEGPGLVFVTMPVAFSAMPFGYILGVTFFLLLFVAAYTTTIGMLEPVVAYLEERWNRGRLALAIWAGLVIWLIGILPGLSDSVLADVRPLAFITGLADKSIFETFDFITASVLIPINAFLIALFAGWVVSVETFKSELGFRSDALFNVWIVLMRYMVPLAVLIITISGLLG